MKASNHIFTTFIMFVCVCLTSDVIAVFSPLSDLAIFEYSVYR